MLDMDGDGTLELLVSHGESASQPLSLYVTPPNDNHFLRVQVNTVFGAPARGAIVELIGETRSQRRLIDAGSGYLCQMEPVAHFGLGRDSRIPTVKVTWPGGATWMGKPQSVDGLLVLDPSGLVDFRDMRR